MSSFLVVVVAIFLDRLLGEPVSYHPLRGFAKIANMVDRLWHKQEDQVLPEAKSGKQINQLINTTVKIKGALAVLFLVLPFVAMAMFLDKIQLVNFICASLLLYLCLGAHSLRRHAMEVHKALEQDNLELARTKVGLMVSSDTSTMNKEDILLTCVESILENGNDAVLAPIFWFVFLGLGAPGAVLYRLVNTLDALWGYKNARYQNFGWAAAKLDNLLNWIPIRLTAVSYILLGDIKAGWRSLSQAKTWYLPNAAPVMAAGSGALGIEISGIYGEDQLKNKVKLGLGKQPQLADISRCCDLVERSMILWLAIILVLSLSHC